MSAEIKVTMALVVRKGGTLEGIDLGTFSVTMTGGNVIRNRQTVGTVAEALVLGDAGAGGWILLVNRDASNFVGLVANSGGTYFIRMMPGEGALFRVDATASAPFIKADTAACEVEYLLLEN